MPYISASETLKTGLYVEKLWVKSHTRTAEGTEGRPPWPFDGNGMELGSVARTFSQQRLTESVLLISAQPSFRQWCGSDTPNDRNPFPPGASVLVGTCTQQANGREKYTMC